MSTNNVPAWTPPAYNAPNWNTPLDAQLIALTQAVNTPAVYVQAAAPTDPGAWVWLNIADPNNAVLTFNDGL